MPRNTPYPWPLRLVLAVLAVVLIFGLFATMTALSRPSRFVNALQTVRSGASPASAFPELPILNAHRFLYLSGPILSAAGEEGEPLFRPGESPALVPAVFEDNTGAFEVVSHNLPHTASPPESYVFGEPVHFIGWRTSTTALTLFALAREKNELLALLAGMAPNWKITLFLHGLLLAIITFTVFWLLNIALLSNLSLRRVQLFIVNAVFLVLYYSVLVLSSYPLTSTLLETAGILVVANALFVPLSLILRPRS